MQLVKQQCRDGQTEDKHRTHTKKKIIKKQKKKDKGKEKKK